MLKAVGTPYFIDNSELLPKGFVEESISTVLLRGGSFVIFLKVQVQDISKVPSS